MRKSAIIVIAVVLAGAASAFGYLYYNAEQNRARPLDEALAAVASTPEVEVQQQGNFLVMRPVGQSPRLGLIVYPGAYCDPRGYAPVTRAIAAAGYLVVSVRMPFDFAIFAPDRADAVREAFPEIESWVIAGHSMGGGMAGRYAWKNQDRLAGLILWDSRVAESNDLADSSLPVVTIHRATMAGEPPDLYASHADLLPEQARWVPIRGGIHMYFGAFHEGHYVEEWTPQISRGEQHRQIVAATLDALAWMQPSAVVWR